MSKNLSSIITVLGVSTLSLLAQRKGSQYGRGFFDVDGLHNLDKVPHYRRNYIDTLWVDGLINSDKYLIDRHGNEVKPPDNLGEILLSFPNLENLQIRDTNIGDFPSEIGMLTKLKRITLTNCRLTSIPESIGNLTNLVHLDLSKNRLSSLPDSIGNLVKLVHLDVSKNNLSYLPEVIGNLVNVNHLDLGNNQLTILPKSLADLKSVRGLFWIYSNNLVRPSPLVLKYWVENMPEIMFRDIMTTVNSSKNSSSQLRRF